jgi:DeoR/GlpR family transcriptional regulator of sugar metabolism
MFQEERRVWLTSHARNNGRVDVTECAEALGVTVETIRRDLNDLENKNVLRRVHGGAIPIEGSMYESNLATRSTQFIDEKRRITQKALEFIGEAETIFLDEGYTMQLLAEVWNPQRKVTVVTNAIHTAAVLLQKQNVEVIFLGGKVRSTTDATSDHWTTRQLSELVLDLAIMGANGVSVDHGCTAPSATCCATKAAAIKAAHKSILLATSNRFGFDSFVKFSDLSVYSDVITDSEMDEATYNKFSAAGLRITRA